MKTIDLKNYRVIKATFVSPTNNRGARIKLFEPSRCNDMRTESKIFEYDHDFDNVLDQAIEILERNGMNPICKGSETDYYYILCDNWGEYFKSIKELK